MSMIARLWAAGHASEDAMAKLGSMWWDAIGKRFGVFNNEGGVVSWYPRLNGTRMDMNQGQRLSGLDNTGAQNRIVMDWSQAGSVRFVDATTGTVVADIGLTGQVFAAGASLAAGSVGNFNYLVNAAFQVRRSLLAGPASYSTSDAGLASPGLLPADNIGYWRSPVMIAPNWFAFRKNGAGKATFSIAPGPGNIPAVKVIAKGAVMGTGVRMYCYDYASLLQGPLSFSQVMKGPVGSVCTIRVITEMGGVVATKTVNGTGDWHGESIDAFNLLDNTSKWLAVDVIYNPGANSSAEVSWYAQKPQITLTPTPVPFQTRSAAVESSYVRSFFYEAKASFDASADAPLQRSVINTDLLSSFGAPRLDYRFDTGEAATCTADTNALTLTRRYLGNTPSAPGIPATLAAANARVCAYVIPATDLDLA